MDKSACCIELYFLPNISWYYATDMYTDIIVDTSSSYQKQSFRNRAYILNSNGLLQLRVPVSGSQHLPYTETRIDYRQNWQMVNWRGITSSYNKSPYFEHFSDGLKEVLLSKPEFLYEYNLALIQYVNAMLRNKKKVTCLHTCGINTDLLTDLRGQIKNKTKSPELVAEPYFEPYRQVFGNKFVSNLSILDVLFCCGPNAGEIIKKTQFPV